MSASSEVFDAPAYARNVRVVLVETSHPGNIGAVARAMKTMQLSVLHLVNPKSFPSAEATARAAGADDLLYHAVQHRCLTDALAGCSLVVATSARSRHLQWPTLAPRECARQLVSEAAIGPVALVFGRENAGLTNRELELCQRMVKIPTNPAFRSLNIAAAVQLMGYEIQLAWPEASVGVDGRSQAAERISNEELEGFYAHLRTTLVELGYLKEAAPKLLMRRLRRMFSRIELERSELNILRGILTAIERKIRDV